jgi:hypothetical protein
MDKQVVVRSNRDTPDHTGMEHLVRLYRPHDSILSGAWKFPVAEQVS